MLLGGSKPTPKADKPWWMVEEEVEQNKRIKSALSAMQTTMASKTPVNMMLHGPSQPKTKKTSY